MKNKSPIRHLVAQALASNPFRASLLAVLLLLVAQASVPVTAHAQVPGIINYQGRIVDAGTNFDGTGQFKFALVNTSGTTNYWSNDGTTFGPPSAAVSLTVTKGLYSVLLGDTTIANMSVALSPAVFANSNVRLRVWFWDGNGSQVFQQLSPDQRLAAVGYALTVANVQAAGDNTFVGQSAGNATMSGDNNTATGSRALLSNTSGNNNTATGDGALVSNSNGNENTANGEASLGHNLSGSGNTTMGLGSLYENTTGNQNTAIGEYTLGNATGNGNTAVGTEALFTLTTGDYNIALGSGAGDNLTTGDNNIDIGNQGVAGEAGIIRIGTPGTHTATYLAGTVNATAFVGDGSGLTNLPSSQLPAGLVTNNQTGVTLSGSFTGTFNGNATTATSASSATTAGSATTANNFSGSLGGDVTGLQNATVVGAVGGVTAANVASGATAANNATSANTAGAIVKRDGSGNITVATVTGSLNGNAATATSASSATTAASFTGSVADNQLSANVPLINGKNTFSGSTNTFNGVSSTAGGLIIETRTGTDPSSPAIGQMWLRTDL